MSDPALKLCVNCEHHRETLTHQCARAPYPNKVTGLPVWLDCRNERHGWESPIECCGPAAVFFKPKAEDAPPSV